MPKAARYALIWSPERGRYELYERGAAAALLVCEDDPAWVAWLEAHSSFAFEGRRGRVNVLKERRAGSGAGYWYGYRRQGARTVKQYVGRSSDLAAARLEAVAAALVQAAGPPPERAVVPQDHPARVPQGAVLQEHPARVPQGAGVVTQALPILAPKLQQPRLPGLLVARERLYARLDAGRERKLTLLVAPAGFGKTTLVAGWLRARATPAGWVALDAADNDPIRFWRYLISACQTFDPSLGQAALALLAAALQPPFEPLPQEMVLTPLLNELAQRSEPALLVLEDYHTITAPHIHAGLAFLLDHLPASLHLIIMTRAAPPLPLARLRARAELCELYAADLRFSAEETRRFFLQSSALALEPAQIAQLDTQLEGWAAGLRLLALALGSGAREGQVAQIVGSFTGSQRSVREYFIGEILQAQPAATQDFLLRTAFLARLTGPLCDAVAAQGAPAEPSAAVLEALARANLFLEPLDDIGQWYRYHALFAEAMQYEARQRLGAAALRDVLLTASGWYAQHSMYAEAIEAALQAQEWEQAAGLIERLIRHQQHPFELQFLSEQGEYVTLRRWLEQLPDPVMRQHPQLCFGYAVTLLLVFMSDHLPDPSLDTLEAALDLAEQGFRRVENQAKLGEVLALRSLIAKNQGAVAESVAWARRSLALLPAEEVVWRGVSVCMIAAGELFAGRLDLARQLFLESHAISAAVQNQLFMRATMGMLSEVYVEQGLLDQAHRICRQLLAEAREQVDWEDVAHALLGCAYLAYEWNRFDEAEQDAAEAQRVGAEYAEVEFQFQATLLLAQIEHTRGRHGAVLQRLAELIDQVQGAPSLYMRRFHRAVLAFQAQVRVAAGELLAAQRWADWRADDDLELGDLQRKREELLVARLALAQGRPEEALPTLERLCAGAQQAGHTRFGLEAQVSLALAYAAARQAPEARRLILAALAQAAGEGYMRLFLDEGAPAAELLRAVLPSVREPGLRGYLRALLKAFDPPQAPPSPAGLIEPLSRQEQRVLQLLAAGHSNPEIAARLVVSVNTVKAHLKSIYRKLDVRNRREASDWARQLHPSA